MAKLSWRDSRGPPREQETGPSLKLKDRPVGVPWRRPGPLHEHWDVPGHLAAWIRAASPAPGNQVPLAWCWVVPHGGACQPRLTPRVSGLGFTWDSLWEEACVDFVLRTQLCSLLFSRWNQEGWERGKRLRGLAARLAQALPPWAGPRGVGAGTGVVCWGQDARPPFLPSSGCLPASLLPFTLGSPEEGEGAAGWAGGQTHSFCPRGTGFPCAGLGEEVINDSEAGGGAFRANVGINQELVPSEG